MPTSPTPSSVANVTPTVCPAVLRPVEESTPRATQPAARRASAHATPPFATDAFTTSGPPFFAHATQTTPLPLARGCDPAAGPADPAIDAKTLVAMPIPAPDAPQWPTYAAHMRAVLHHAHDAVKQQRGQPFVQSPMHTQVVDDLLPLMHTGAVIHDPACSDLCAKLAKHLVTLGQSNVRITERVLLLIQLMRMRQAISANPIGAVLFQQADTAARKQTLLDQLNDAVSAGIHEFVAHFGTDGLAACWQHPVFARDPDALCFLLDITDVFNDHIIQDSAYHNGAGTLQRLHQAMTARMAEYSADPSTLPCPLDTSPMEYIVRLNHRVQRTLRRLVDCAGYLPTPGVMMTEPQSAHTRDHAAFLRNVDEANVLNRYLNQEDEDLSRAVLDGVRRCLDIDPDVHPMPCQVDLMQTLANLCHSHHADIRERAMGYIAAHLNAIAHTTMSKPMDTVSATDWGLIASFLYATASLLVCDDGAIRKQYGDVLDVLARVLAAAKQSPAHSDCLPFQDAMCAIGKTREQVASLYSGVSPQPPHPPPSTDFRRLTLKEVYLVSAWAFGNTEERNRLDDHSPMPPDPFAAWICGGHLALSLILPPDGNLEWRAATMLLEFHRHMGQHIRSLRDQPTLTPSLEVSGDFAYEMMCRTSRLLLLHTYSPQTTLSREQIDMMVQLALELVEISNHSNSIVLPTRIAEQLTKQHPKPVEQLAELCRAIAESATHGIVETDPNTLRHLMAVVDGLIVANPSIQASVLRFYQAVAESPTEELRRKAESALAKHVGTIAAKLAAPQTLAHGEAAVLRPALEDTAQLAASPNADVRANYARVINTLCTTHQACVDDAASMLGQSLIALRACVNQSESVFSTAESASEPLPDLDISNHRALFSLQLQLGLRAFKSTATVYSLKYMVWALGDMARYGLYPNLPNSLTPIFEDTLQRHASLIAPDGEPAAVTRALLDDAKGSTRTQYFALRYRCIDGNHAMALRATFDASTQTFTLAIMNTGSGTAYYHEHRLLTKAVRNRSYPHFQKPQKDPSCAPKIVHTMARQVYQDCDPVHGRDQYKEFNNAFRLQRLRSFMPLLDESHEEMHQMSNKELFAHGRRKVMKRLVSAMRPVQPTAHPESFQFPRDVYDLSFEVRRIPPARAEESVLTLLRHQKSTVFDTDAKAIDAYYRSLGAQVQMQEFASIAATQGTGSVASGLLPKVCATILTKMECVISLGSEQPKPLFVLDKFRESYVPNNFDGFETAFVATLQSSEHRDVVMTRDDIQKLYDLLRDRAETHGCLARDRDPLMARQNVHE